MNKPNLEKILEQIKMEGEQMEWWEIETFLKIKMPGYTFEFFARGEDVGPYYFDEVTEIMDVVIQHRLAEDMQTGYLHSTNMDCTESEYVREYYIIAIKENANVQ